MMEWASMGLTYYGTLNMLRFTLQLWIMNIDMGRGSNYKIMFPHLKNYPTNSSLQPPTSNLQRLATQKIKNDYVFLHSPYLFNLDDIDKGVQ